MSDESGEEPSSFWKAAGWFQQFAVPFAQVRGMEELTRWGSRPPLEALVYAARAGMIGRRVETGSGDRRIAFTLSELDASFDPLGANAGQADNVSLAADAVEYAGLEVVRVVARLRNVHTRIGLRPELVCAPVDLDVTVAGEQAASLLRRYAPRLAASFVAPGQMRLRMRKHPRWGWLDVRPVVVQGRVTLRPVALGWRKREWRFKHRVVAMTLPTRLPEGVRITDLTVVPDTLTLNVRVDEWRVEYSRILGLAKKAR